MLSDILCGGSLHSLSMTIVGMRAKPARMVQPDADVTLVASPTAPIASVHSAANASFECLRCMIQGYRSVHSGAVQQCTYELMVGVR